MAITIWGHSDDVVCFCADTAQGGTVEDEVSAGSYVVALLVGETGDERDRAGVAVTMSYGAVMAPSVDGVWSANVSQIGEGGTVPWPVRICTNADATNPYTVAVVIECPPGTKFRVLRRTVVHQKTSEWSVWGHGDTDTFTRVR